MTEQSKTKELGLEYARLIKQQDEVIRRGCPMCGGALTDSNLIEVRCKKCRKRFEINRLLSLAFSK